MIAWYSSRSGLDERVPTKNSLTETRGIAYRKKEDEQLSRSFYIMRLTLRDLSGSISVVGLTRDAIRN